MIFYVFSSILTLFISFGVVLGGMYITTAKSNFHRYSAYSIYAVIISTITIKTLMLNRNLSNYSLDPYSINGLQSTILDWVLRITTVVIVLISIFSILRSYSFIYLHAEKKVKNTGIYFFAFFIFWFSNYILNSFLGTVPDFKFNTIFPLIVFFAAYCSRNDPVNSLVKYFLTVCVIYVLLSVFVALLKPELAVQFNYHGLIPYFNIRLWGVDVHPNSLGPLVALISLILIFILNKWSYLRVIVLFMSLCVLFLTQSKTSWLSFFSTLSVTYLIIYNSKKNKGVSFWLLNFIFIFFIFCIYQIHDVVLNSLFLDDFDTKTLKGIESLSGRDVIWNISISKALGNILFGYGPTLWGPEFSASYGLLGIASNAHNQIIDSFSSAGLFGAVGFLFYFLVLSYYAWRIRVETCYFSCALIVYMIVRSISEVPFKVTNITSNEFIIHLFIFTYIIRSYVKIESKRETVNAN